MWCASCVFQEILHFNIIWLRIDGFLEWIHLSCAVTFTQKCPFSSSGEKVARYYLEYSNTKRGYEPPYQVTLQKYCKTLDLNTLFFRNSNTTLVVKLNDICRFFLCTISIFYPFRYDIQYAMIFRSGRFSENISKALKFFAGRCAMHRCLTNA